MRLTVLLLTLVFCTGCATSMKPVPDASGAQSPLLRFQNPALTPRNGGQLIAGEALQPGDILLSAANGIPSIGIRLLTLAPVSHASLYVGDQQVVEAVGQGVRMRKLDDVIGEEAVVAVFRHPELRPEQGDAIRRFAMQNVGKPYDHFGIVLQAPFSIQRRLCELPLIPEVVRNACLQGIATIQLGTANNDRFFCSQLVLESYRQAGLPLTHADPRWVSPADIMHMREGDVPAMRTHQSLAYIGHLKFQAETTIAQGE